MDLDQALVLFDTQLRADGRSEHTRRQYARHVRLLICWAAQEGLCCDVAAFGPEHVAAFLASPAVTRRADGGPRKATSANSLRTSVRGFFAYLVAVGILDQDPARRVRRALCGPPPPRGLSQDELARLLGAMEDDPGDAARRDRMLFGLMAGSGLRLSEGLGLDVADLDLERGEAAVRHGKGDRARVAILPKSVVAELRAFLRRRARGPVFLASNGRRLGHRQAQRRFASWAGLVGLRDACPHSLRHGFAIDLHERTGDLLLVRDALGHASVSSTSIYVRVSRKALRKAVGA